MNYLQVRSKYHENTCWMISIHDFYAESVSDSMTWVTPKRKIDKNLRDNTGNFCLRNFRKYFSKHWNFLELFVSELGIETMILKDCVVENFGLAHQTSFILTNLQRTPPLTGSLSNFLTWVLSRHCLFSLSVTFRLAFIDDVNTEMMMMLLWHFLLVQNLFKRTENYLQLWFILQFWLKLKQINLKFPWPSFAVHRALKATHWCIWMYHSCNDATARHNTKSRDWAFNTSDNDEKMFS